MNRHKYYNLKYFTYLSKINIKYMFIIYLNTFYFLKNKYQDYPFSLT